MQVLYCSDDAHSQQNRCLISGRDLLNATDGDSHTAFLRLLERQRLKYASVLPLDLRVRGLVSTRFDYDGSALPYLPHRVTTILGVSSDELSVCLTLDIS